MRILRKLATLSAEERRLLSRASLWLVVARVGLGVLSFQAMRRLFDRFSSGASLVGCTANQVRWAVLAIASRLPGTRCLARSLALDAMLRQAAIPSELQIGVAKGPDGSLLAHAWVTSEGRPLLQDEDLSAYAPLLSLPR